MGSEVGQVLFGVAVKAANPALLALFATDQHFEQFDLYTFTLTSGYVLRYSSCPFNVVFGGNTWLSATAIGSVVIDEAGDTGPRAHWTSDLNVGTWEVTVLSRPNDVIGSLPWLPAVRAGILNEAIVSVDRGYISAWPATAPGSTLVPIGTVNAFTGRVAEIDFGRSAVTINMNDPRELLAIDYPRNLYTAGCRYALFDNQCTLSAAAFALPCTVTGIVSLTQVAISLPDRVQDYFALGNAAFTGGLNAGLRMMVRSSLTSHVTFLAPLPFTIAIGDAITLTPGCDKTQSTCQNKFNNLPNFGGFPYIPAAETAV